MNTEQKAREWVNMVSIIRSIAVNKREPIEIITALLAEREALLDALKKIANTDPDDGTSWFHDVANKTIAMCEEQNNE